ncbi:MAG: transcriptional regulator [Kangiella sp.]|nr:MAG: transcriptional regulator [Kangiella sp.]
MNIQSVAKMAHKLQEKLPFVAGINTSEEHEEALSIMDELTENYDNNLLLINYLWPKIEAYEETAPELLLFNERIKNINPGASMLRLLMEHHNLNTTDFKNEIGQKGNVSMICNEKRNLTAEHIKKLSVRFGVTPALFF